MNKRIVWGMALGMAIPYFVTLAWTGGAQAQERLPRQETPAEQTPKILLDREGAGYYLSVEDYLSGVLAGQIQPESEPEALRAQAIIARTYIYREMKAGADTWGGREIPESALDMDYMENAGMRELWGSETFPELFERLEQAVKSTSGVVMTWEGEYISPMFCKASAGRTRRGDQNYPYLEAVNCPDDPEADGFIQEETWSFRDFRKAVYELFPGENTEWNGEGPQVVSRDASGYVEEISIDGKLFTGEQVRQALGLQSAAFVLGQSDGEIRAVARGIGHGYGLSQIQAQALAKKGWQAEDILQHFYKNIRLISE